MRAICLHRNADKGPREVHACLSRHRPLVREFVEALLREDNYIGILAAAQPVEQRERGREIGVDPRAAFCFITRCKSANRAFERQGREYSNSVHLKPYARRISFSTAVKRRLRLPASAVASSSAPSSSQVPEKPMPTSWPPKIGFSPTAGVCS
jgi:hypothetical protein